MSHHLMALGQSGLEQWFFITSCWLPHALSCPNPGRGRGLSKSCGSLTLVSLIPDWGAGEVPGGGLLCGKVSPLPLWDAMASAGLEFGSLTLEALVQPWVPPLKREAGKPEGV